MIFIFPMGDLFLAVCIIVMVWGLTGLHDSQAPFGLVATLIFLPGLYVYWRFRRLIQWTAWALKSAVIFMYLLITGKDPEDEEWRE